MSCWREKDMIKMIIQMDEEKISKSSEYSLEKIYSVIDDIFKKRG